MAPRTINRLTDLTIRKAKAAGWYADGGGLYLRVESATAKKWVFVFQWRKKRAEMGLGALQDVSLGEARDARDAARKLVAAGKNPVEERRREREEQAARAAAETARKTFGEWAEEIAPAVGPKAEKARKAWVNMMQVKVGALAQMVPEDIRTDHVLESLKPYWLSRPESGKRMRQRIERVLDAAKSKGLIAEPWNNPARLRGHLENLLPRRSTAVRHRLALPYAEAPAFMSELREIDRVVARCLEFCVLTAVRNIEVRGARKREIDRKNKLWIIPAARMKGPEELRREHRVPLTPAMERVLDQVWDVTPDDPDAFIFPSPKGKGRMFSENALQDLVEEMGLKGRATVHGFRSCFRDWAGDCTNFQRETIEQALAHKIEDDTERAYRRSDALLKRRKLMEAWSSYLARPAASNVRPMARPA